MARPTAQKKPLPKTQIGLWLEGLAPWRGTLIGAAILASVFIGSRIDAVRPTEAVVVALAFPAGAILLGAAALRDASRGVLMLGLLVVLGGLAVSEVEASEAIFPGAPLGTATLRPTAADLRVHVPNAVHALEVEVRGHVDAPADQSAAGNFRLTFDRGTDTREMTGRFKREVHQGRMGRRAAIGTTVSQHKVERKDIVLPGRGPVRVHLAQVEGRLHPALRVAVYAAPTRDEIRITLMAAFLLLGAVTEGLAAREGVRSAVAAGIAAAAVLAVYVTHRWDPNDPFTTVFAGSIIALLAGAGGGFVLGSLAQVLLRRRAPNDA